MASSSASSVSSSTTITSKDMPKRDDMTTGEANVSSLKSQCFCYEFFSLRDGVKEETIDALIGADFDTIHSLLAMDLVTDLDGLGLSLGQRAVVRAGVKALADYYHQMVSNGLIDETSRRLSITRLVRETVGLVVDDNDDDDNTVVSDDDEEPEGEDESVVLANDVEEEVVQRPDSGQRVCDICGDGASGRAYQRGRACYPCVLFYRRCQEVGLPLECTTGAGDCHVTKATRADCRRCRWERCVDVMASRGGSQSSEATVNDSSYSETTRNGSFSSQRPTTDSPTAEVPLNDSSSPESPPNGRRSLMNIDLNVADFDVIEDYDDFMANSSYLLDSQPFIQLSAIDERLKKSRSDRKSPKSQRNVTKDSQPTGSASKCSTEETKSEPKTCHVNKRKGKSPKKLSELSLFDNCLPKTAKTSKPFQYYRKSNGAKDNAISDEDLIIKKLFAPIGEHREVSIPMATVECGRNPMAPMKGDSIPVSTASRKRKKCMNPNYVYDS